MTCLRTTQKWNAPQTNRTIIRWFLNVVFECYFCNFLMVGSDYLFQPTDTLDKVSCKRNLRKSGASLSPPISMLSSKLCWRTLHVEYWVQIRVHSKPTLKSGVPGLYKRSHLQFLSNVMSLYNTIARHGRYANKSCIPKGLAKHVSTYVCPSR